MDNEQASALFDETALRIFDNWEAIAVRSNSGSVVQSATLDELDAREAFLHGARLIRRSLGLGDSPGIVLRLFGSRAALEGVGK